MNATVSTDPPTRARQALVVAADPLMLAVLGDLLRERGFDAIATAGNGTAGIEAFERYRPPPDLVVCDLHMPGNDGFQFMEQLGARGYAGRVIVV